MGKGLTVPQKLEALSRIATGESQVSIAKDLGVHKSNISRLKNKSESKAVIERESERMLESLPDIVAARKLGVSTMLKLMEFFSGQSDHGAQEIVNRLKTTTLLQSMGKNDRKQILEVLKESKMPVLKLFEILSRQSSDYLKAVGILPSQSPSLFIKNVYQDNRKQVFSPRVLEMIGKFGATLRLPENDPPQGPQPQDVVSKDTKEG